MTWLTAIKTIAENIIHFIDDRCKEHDDDMEQWKEEDPEAYYAYIAQEESKRY